MAAPVASATSPLAQLVLAQLQKYPTLDPRAVLAVGSREGLSGRIGDGGHAFGFSQENDAGGVLTNRFPGLSPAQLEAWANSPEGIDDALTRMSKVAGGLKGTAAINAIVSRYERPADIPGEIAGATAAYGGQPAGIGAPLTTPVPGASMSEADGANAAAALAGKQSILNALIASNQAIASGGTNDANAQTLSLLQALPALNAAGQGEASPTAGITGQGPPATAQGVPGVVKAATQFLGVPYAYGGNNPKTGLDCSSFVQHAYAEVGVALPRTTTQQIAVGTKVNLADLQPGDVVFTEPGKGPSGGPGHEGLYIGKGMIQESPHTGTVNQKISLKTFLGGGFVGARRYSPSGPQKA